MIHTCSLCFPRMQWHMLHCSEVFALTSVVSVQYYSSIHQAQCCILPASLCFDWSDCNILFFLKVPQKCEGCTVSLFSKVRSYGAEHLLMYLFLVDLLFSSMRNQIKVTTDISNLVTLTQSWKYSSHKTVIPSGFLGCLNQGNIPVICFKKRKSEMYFL